MSTKVESINLKISEHQRNRPPIGYWKSSDGSGVFRGESLRELLFDVRKQFYAVMDDGDSVFATGGKFSSEMELSSAGSLPVFTFVPGINPENLGDIEFCRDYNIKYPYIGGSMAHGISSAQMVENLAAADMLAFFGSAGMSIPAIESAIDRLSKNLDGKSFGFNLIHSPGEPDVEDAICDLFIRKGIKLIEASAYLDLTPAVIRYRVHGIHESADGRVITPNKIIAKVSRTEIATKFFSPPPEKYLTQLVNSGDITERQAELARRIPVAQDVTAEADSGGHTDNRPLVALLPTMIALKDRMQKEFGYEQKLRVGAAGGISTPQAAAAAFSMGAAYIVTGSVNQACVESGTSDAVRKALAVTEQADVTMAPSADMFEMGVKVQVLKRGTMFPMRSAKLSEIYKTCSCVDEISAEDRQMLEKSIFKGSLDEVWAKTKSFFQERDPSQIDAAQKNPKHKMALIFRWYLGQASHWATSGDPVRMIDYQIWCGPAMGAFNEWTKGSFLENTDNRKVADIALNLLFGACVIFRINSLRYQGFPVSQGCEPYPLKREQIENYLK